MTDWVRLNVGGTMFETTRTTLTSDRDSILAKMFDPDSDRAAASVNQDGVFLIDACPRAFAVILNWLRYKDVILSKDIRAEEVIPVADYFGLDALCEKLNQNKISDKDSLVCIESSIRNISGFMEQDRRDKDDKAGYRKNPSKYFYTIEHSLANINETLMMMKK